MQIQTERRAETSKDGERSKTAKKEKLKVPKRDTSYTYMRSQGKLKLSWLNSGSRGMTRRH